MRVLRGDGADVVGLDVLGSPWTDVLGSITDAALVARLMRGVDTVMHTATLHKPHVGSHGKQDFVETNVTGTLTLLEAAVSAGVRSFVFTSTTSAFGRALVPPAGEPAAWIDEGARPVPRNVYGVTKSATEDLCEVVHQEHGLPVVVLRTSRFFPEQDDRDEVRLAYPDDNVKVNELLYCRVDLEDVVSAHRLAARRAPELGFGRYVVTATTPFSRDDAPMLRNNAPAVVERLFPHYADVYARRGWRMFAGLDRVYDNANARRALGWTPVRDLRFALDAVAGRRGLAQPARMRGRRQGLPRETDRRVHHAYGDGSWRIGAGRFPACSTTAGLPFDGMSARFPEEVRRWDGQHGAAAVRESGSRGCVG